MKHLHIFGASASLLMACSAMATESVANLDVTGSIAPGGACVIAIGGALNLGTIKPDKEHPDLPTKLAQQRVPVAVGCPQPQRFAFIAREAGGQDSSSPLAFAMREDAGDSRPGSLFLNFDTQSTKIDGAQGYATASEGVDGLEDTGWGPATPYEENLPIPNGRWAVGFVTEAHSTRAPENIKNLSVTLLVRPEIKPVNDLDLSGEIAFSSDLGLEIRYF